MSSGARRCVTEASVGITEHTTAGSGFRAVTKARFSDFIVHEVDLSGEMATLTQLPSVPTPTPPDSAPPPAEALAELQSLLSAADAAAALDLHTRVVGSTAAADEELLLTRCDDKEARRAVHQLVKRLLPALESDTADGDGGGKCVRLRGKLRGGGGGRGGGRGGGKRRRFDSRVEWPDEAGSNKYLQFSLYKENRESMDAVSRIAKALHVSPNTFGFAGTKDRRAVTTQRGTAFRVTKERLAAFMAHAPFGDSIRVGDFSYVAQPLRLGMLSANHFTITLRDVDASEQELETALQGLRRNGFLNYFGLQRFGHAADAPTHAIGAAMLRTDWDEALRLIMAPRADDPADEATARADFMRTRDASAALQAMPRRMSAERALLEGLKRVAPNNVLGAINYMPRNMRAMYLHALQSFAWNHAASHRARVHGVERAVEGDLVLSPAKGPDANPEPPDRQTDPSDSPKAEPSAAGGGGEPGAGAAAEPSDADGDADGVAADADADASARVHVVSAAEACAGVYSIRDVVLPLPGHSVAMPTNDTTRAYADAMAVYGLELDSFRGRHRIQQFQLPGSYRRLIGVPSDLGWEIVRYDDEKLQLVSTDLGEIRSEPLPPRAEAGERTALVLRFALPPSTYATMLLRELTKQPSELSHQIAMMGQAPAAAAPPAEPTAEPGDGSPQPAGVQGAEDTGPTEKRQRV